MIRKWLPQNDILAHPNVVLVISHGSMFTNFDALNYAIPLLIIPFFGDQYQNALRVATAGYGKYLDFTEITNTLLLSNIEELLGNKSYLEKAKEISNVFRDNLVDPMEEAMWWIEYVVRNKGAKHLKSHAVNISWFSYLLIDVVIATVLSSLIVAFALYFVFRRFCCCRKNISSHKFKND